jgi:NAD(P)H-flavin reductase
MARITCPANLIPRPGQYVLARAERSESALATELFATRILGDGFVADHTPPDEWKPGASVHLRGPLGHGFSIPRDARRIALIAWDNEPRRLLVLVDPAAQQDAAITLICENPPEDLSLQVEAQPHRALRDVLRWADFIAIDVPRASFSSMWREVGDSDAGGGSRSIQALIRTRMPCGGVGECGVCTVRLRNGPRLACVDGPVFDLSSLGAER